MKIKILAASLASLLLMTGCNTIEQKTEIVERARVVIPPEELFKCPEIKNYPNWQTLTNYEVAQLIVKLSKNNEICRENIQSIKRYLYRVQEEING